MLKMQPILVGGGTDGASVNIAQHSRIKQELQAALPWLYWSWCYAHRLELAAKNSLVSSLLRILKKCFFAYTIFMRSLQKNLGS